jgi:hypothetical protein
VRQDDSHPARELQVVDEKRDPQGATPNIADAR